MIFIGGNLLNTIQMDLDDDSIQVQMPIEERKRVTSVISSWQFSTHSDEPNQVKLFLLASQIYIRNLISRKEEPSFKDQLKGKIPAGTLLYQPFAVNFHKTNGKENVPINCEGELIIAYLQYRGLKLMLRFEAFEVIPTDYLTAKFLLYEGIGEDPRPKTFRLQHEGQNIWSCLIDDGDLDKVLKSRLAVQVFFQRQSERDQRFVGIRNEGNTCYMNSILQILFFLKPIRKMIVDYTGESKLMLALRDIFLNLINEPRGSRQPVDAEDLIEAYGRFAEYPRRQQDTHEFLLGFLEELEGQCPSLAQLWQGQSCQLLESVEGDKPYRSSVKEDFNGLDLPLQDFKGNTFGSLYDSMKYLLQKEHVQDKIQTDDYGKVSVIKSRQFMALPPVLFLTLKRYEFKKIQARPTKVLADLCYPKGINLGFLLGTPTGDDMEYELYAVTVHRGQHYCSGHYYSFVNTSSDLSEPCWMRFDDSRVYLASEEQALDFTGGKRKTVTWNAEVQRFLQKQFKAEDTAYVLVYFKRQLFESYQSIDVPIPREWIAKKRLDKAHERINQEEDLYQVEVAIADIDTDLDLFGNLSTIPVGLKHNEDIVSQLKRLDYNLLGCKVGTVWKVIKKEQIIKCLVEFADLPQTPQRVFDPKRGHRIPDYLLILPESAPVFRNLSSLVVTSKLGLVRVTVILQEGFSSFFRLIRKQTLEDFISQEQVRLQKKGTIQIDQKDNFLQDWNDICNVFFE